MVGVRVSTTSFYPDFYSLWFVPCDFSLHRTSRIACSGESQRHLQYFVAVDFDDRAMVGRAAQFGHFAAVDFLYFGWNQPCGCTFLAGEFVCTPLRCRYRSEPFFDFWRRSCGRANRVGIGRGRRFFLGGVCR